MVRLLSVIFSIFLLSGLALIHNPVFAQDNKETVCPPGLTLRFPITGIVIIPDTFVVNTDFHICNGTDKESTVRIQITGVPENWNVQVRPQSGFQSLTVVAMPPNQSQRFTLRLDPPDDETLEPFDLNLRIESDQGLSDQTTILIQAVTTVAAEFGGGEGTTIERTFTKLSGPSVALGSNTPSSFEFQFTVRKDSGKEVTVDLDVEVPEDWKAVFTNAFGQRNVIRSVTILPDRLSENLAIQVTPPLFAPPGDYPVLVTITLNGEEHSLPFKVTIIPSFGITLTTPDGRTTLDTNAGDATVSQLRIVNTGTADLQGLELIPDLPQGWEAVFNPPLVENIATNDLKDVQFELKVPDNETPGDYVISLKARNANAQASLGLRVIVEKGSVWPWVGLGLLILALISMAGLVAKVSRK